MDAGDFTGDPTVPGEKLTHALIEGMNRIGYEVVNLSMRELSHGYNAFEERRKEARFDLISSNIVWQDTGEPVVDPITIRKVKLGGTSKSRDVRIGFIGLTRNDPAFREEGPGGRRIVTVDPVEAARKYVPELAKKADVVVALSSLDLGTAKGLPKKVEGIDLVLGGLGTHRTRADDFPEDTRFGRTSVMYIGDQGKNLGEVRLFFDGKNGLKSTQRSLVGLTREWPDEPELARFVEETKQEINEWNKAQAEANNPFAAPKRAVGSQPIYTGSARCVPCHQEVFVSWTNTPHARAFGTLIREHQEFNPKCVGCHTIGYGRAYGFVDAKATPTLTSVGCEACHGPSSRHPDFVLKGYGQTDTQFCRTCHTAENSPDFDPVTYIPKVRHWDGEPSAP